MRNPKHPRAATVNIAVSKPIHKRLKHAAIDGETDLVALADVAITTGLDAMAVPRPQPQPAAAKERT